jgi:hypothetical protein
MNTSRRSFFHGLVAAPALVAIDSLMPIRGTTLSFDAPSIMTGPIKWRDRCFSELQEAIDHIALNFDVRGAAIGVSVPPWARCWNALGRIQGVETIQVLAGVHYATCVHDPDLLTAMGGDVVKIRVSSAKLLRGNCDPARWSPNQ